MRFSAAEALSASGVDVVALQAELPEVVPSRIPVYAAPGWFRAFWAPGITAIAMPWGVYLHPRRVSEPLESLGPLMVHELTHIAQWRRLGPIGWARSYVGDYVRGRRGGLSHQEAYLGIDLEEEARVVARRITAI